MNLPTNDYVLVVDDDRDIREAICDALADEGYSAVAVANGGEALDYLRANPHPRLIFLDLMMPVMDGWEFRRQQLAEPALAAIPVVAITAGGVAAAAVPVLRLLQKPVRIEELLEALNEHGRCARHLRDSQVSCA